MRMRDSGMPEEAYWESLFDVELVLARLGIDESLQDVAELGCGYGTFSIPIARTIQGQLHTFDIERAMVARTKARAAMIPPGKLKCGLRDVAEAGFGLTEMHAALLFNILHCEEPVRLLKLACDAVRPGGLVLVIHWRYGETPRGPSLDIRPHPEKIVAWATEAGLKQIGEVLDLPPWHYGFRFQRP